MEKEDNIMDELEKRRLQLAEPQEQFNELTDNGLA